MNKRIRKKYLKRTLNELLAVYDEYDARQERIFNRALQDVVDAYGRSKEEFTAAWQHFSEIYFAMASSGPPLRFLINRKTSASA